MINLTIGGQTKRSTLGQHPVEIDWDTLPEASKTFITSYGLKQYLADAMAGAENEADAKAKVESRVAKLVAGDMSRTRGEAKDAPDSVGSRALKLAKATIRASLAKANMKADKETVNDAAGKLAATDAYREQAQAQLDAEKAMGEGMGDDLLASLGLAAK